MSMETGSNSGRLIRLSEAESMCAEIARLAGECMTPIQRERFIERLEAVHDREVQKFMAWRSAVLGGDGQN